MKNEWTDGERKKIKPQSERTPDDMHECLNCEGCFCEETCREAEEKNFPKGD